MTLRHEHALRRPSRAGGVHDRADVSRRCWPHILGSGRGIEQRCDLTVELYGGLDGNAADRDKEVCIYVEGCMPSNSL
jgi:hypothetical protein